MKKLLTLILFLLPYQSYHNNSYAQQSTTNLEIKSVEHIEDFDLAIRLSKDTNKKLVVIFSAEWCQHCKNLKNDLPEIINLNNKIVCIVDADISKKLIRQFKIKSFPTSIILENNKEVSRITGYNRTNYNNWLKNQ